MMDVITPLMTKAKSFTRDTDQKKICELTGEVANALFWNPSCSELGKLQRVLSTALTEMYSGKDWYSRFSAELNKLS